MSESDLIDKVFDEREKDKNTIPPVPMDRATALLIRAGLMQQRKGLEEQIRGIASIIAQIEKSWDIEKQ